MTPPFLSVIINGATPAVIVTVAVPSFGFRHEGCIVEVTEATTSTAPAEMVSKKISVLVQPDPGNVTSTSIR